MLICLLKKTKLFPFGCDLIEYHLMSFSYTVFTFISIIDHLWQKSLNRWWSSILPVSTKGTITYHSNWPHWTQKYRDIWRLKSEFWHNNVGRLRRFNWSQPFSFDNWIPNGNTQTNKQTMQKKHAQLRFHSTRLHTNDNINMDSTIAG